MPASYILTIMKDGETIKTVKAEGELLLGRSEECSIRLDDRAISRQHALFRWNGEQFQVEKKSEFAPLSVNGAEVSTKVLKEGDFIAVGPYQIKISVEKEAQTPSPPPPSPAPSSENQSPAQASPQVLSQNLDQISELPQASEAPQALQAENEALPNVITDSPSPPSALEMGDPLAIDSFESQPHTEEPAAVLDVPMESQESPVKEGELVQEDSSLGPVDEDGKTKLTPMAKVQVKLVFKSGTANYEEYEIVKDEVSIGRGKTCDIILNDKKASRKNAIIQKSGMTFRIKDLDSANGTYVNGVRIKEQELAGDDKIIIGNVEFLFKALSSDYASQEKDFMAIPEEPEMPVDLAAEDSAQAIPNEMQPGQDAGLQNAGEFQGGVADVPGVGGVPSTNEIPGLTGIAGISPSTGKNQSLFDKFKALPKSRQIIVLVCLAVVFYLGLFDEEPAQKVGIKQKKPAPTASASPTLMDKGPMTFERLSSEQKEFVKTQYELAFNYFKNHDYDKSIYEVNKIFDLIPEYQNAREIKRYAEEGRQRLLAIEEERKKKEEEAKLKAKVQKLVEEVAQIMAKKKYEQAKEMFTQIIALDPDNATVATWKKEVDDYEEQIKMQEQQKKVQDDINKQAKYIFEEAMGLKNQRKYHSAIATFQKVLDVGSSDTRLRESAKKMVSICQQLIRKARDPLLKAALKKEKAGEFTQAFALYMKATKVDPPHPTGYAGMNRIKGVLHDRAKAIYTEAILAESYSDFSTAKKMFTECLEVAPPDDIYHERAARKLAHYFKKDEAPSQ